MPRRNTSKHLPDFDSSVWRAGRRMEFTTLDLGNEEQGEDTPLDGTMEPTGTLNPQVSTPPEGTATGDPPAWSGELPRTNEPDSLEETCFGYSIMESPPHKRRRERSWPKGARPANSWTDHAGSQTPGNSIAEPQTQETTSSDTDPSTPGRWSEDGASIGSVTDTLDPPLRDNTVDVNIGHTITSPTPTPADRADHGDDDAFGQTRDSGQNRNRRPLL